MLVSEIVIDIVGQSRTAAVTGFCHSQRNRFYRDFGHCLALFLLARPRTGVLFTGIDFAFSWNPAFAGMTALLRRLDQACGVLFPLGRETLVECVQAFLGRINAPIVLTFATFVEVEPDDG